MKNYIVKQSVQVIDYGTSATPRFQIAEERIDPLTSTDYILTFDNGRAYKGMDRTQVGQFLINNNIVEEVVNGDDSSA